MRRFFCLRACRVGLTLLAALLPLLLTLPARATHLVGGDVSYRYLDRNGTTPGRPFRYELTFSIYGNCTTSGSGMSNVPIGRRAIAVAIFDKVSGQQIADPDHPTDDQLPATSPTNNDGAFIQADAYQFDRTDFVNATPAIPAGCTFQLPCLLLITYRRIVELPASTSGYYAAYSDGNRNFGITNLQNSGGQAQFLYVEMAPPLARLINASPVFSDTAVALVCASPTGLDTTVLSNNAFDANGDRLVYSFVAPSRECWAQTCMASIPTSFIPTAGPPQVPEQVTYAGAAYSAATPFGANGYASINPETGQTKYVIEQTGSYVVGIEVKEFRVLNGVSTQIGSIRRDIQLVVQQCAPPPIPPTSSLTLGGATVTTATIEEGQSYSFLTTAVDATGSGHTFQLTAASPLLDGPGGRNAAFNGQAGTAPNQAIQISGPSPLSGAFTYTSTCGSAGVYPINFSVRDPLSCPVIPSFSSFILTIRAPTPVTRVNGDSIVCPNATATYTAVGIPTGNTGFQWTVTGGTINGASTGATISVTWNILGTGSVSVKAVSARGCPSAAVARSVEVSAGGTAAFSGLQPTYCLSATAPGTPLIGNPSGGTFSITGTGGASNLAGGVFNPRVAGTFQITYSVNNAAGCNAISPAFTVVVNPLPTVVLAATLQATYCQNAAPVTLTGTVNGATATTANATFTIDGTAATVFNPATLPVGPHVVTLTGTGTGGCQTSVSRTVTVNALPTVRLTNLLPAYCRNAPAIPLTATTDGLPVTPPNVVYTIDNVATNLLNPSSLTLGTHTVRVRGVGINGCFGRDSATFIVLPLPVLAITGLNPAYCRDAAPVQLTGTVDGLAVSTANGSFTVDGNPALVFNPAVLSAGPHIVQLTGLNGNNCTNQLTQTVQVNALPAYTLAPFTPSVCLNVGVVTISFTSTVAGTGLFYVIGSTPTNLTTGTSFQFPLNPATLGVGTVRVVYGVSAASTATGCGNLDTLTFTVRPVPVVRLTGLQNAYCRDAAPVPLTGTIDGAPATAPAVQFTIDGTAATVLNPLTLTPGTHTVRVLGTGTNNCTSRDSLVVTINALPAVAFTGLNPAYCAGAAAVPLAATVNGSAANGTVTFTVNGTAATSFDPTTLAPGTYTVVATGTLTATGCVNTTTQTVIINALPTIAITNLNPAYCAGSVSVPLTATVNGLSTGGTVTFTVNGTAATSFNPTTLAPGTYTVVATGTLTATGCVNTATQTVIINALPTVAFTGLNPAYCAGDAAVTLAATLDGAATGGTVTFTVNGQPATAFDPTTLAPGNYTVVATGTLTATGCVGTVTQTVTINALPTIAFTGLNPAYCAGSAAVPLTATVNGSAANGTVTFTVNGTAATSFDPTTLAPGTYTIVATGTLTATGCVNTTTNTVTINALPTIAITNLNPAYCVGSISVPLTATVNGVSTGGTVTFTVNGTAATSFNPTTLAPGIYTVVATGTLTATGCVNTATQTVTIDALPTVAFTGLNPAYCIGSTSVPLAATLNGAATGGTVTFTVNGQPATAFDPSTLAAGNYTVVATGTLTATGCVGTVTQTVTINALPTIAFTGLNPTYCAGSAAVPLTATVNGSAANGTVTFTVNGTAATSFDPTTLAPGTYTVVATGTLTATGCVNTTTSTVTINALPTVAITGLNPAYCVGSAAVPLTATVDGVSTGGNVTFTVNGTAATSFNPAALAPGTYTVVATGTLTATGCVNTATQTVIINALPTVAITNLSPAYCFGSARVTLMASVNGLPNVGTVTFTLNGMPATDLTPLLLPGIYTIVATGTLTATGCVGTATQTVIINALPTIAFTGLNPTYCAGSAAVPLTATVNGSAANGTVAFTVNGTAATSFDPTTLAPGTYTIEATGTLTATGCVNTTTQTVTINALPTIAITNLNPAYCADAAAVPLTATVNGATVGGTVTFTVNGTAATSFNPTTLGAGTYTIIATGTLTATGCQNTTTQTVTVNPLPARPAAVTGPPSVCPGLTGITYTVASPVAGVTYEWTVTGGTLNPANPTGPSAVVDFGGPVTGSIQVVAISASGCRSAPLAYAVRVNQLLQTQTPTGAAAFCVNGGPQTFQIPITTPGSTYQWVVTGTAVGAIQSGQGSATIAVAFTQAGTATLVVTETSSTPLANCRGESAPFTVNVLAAPTATLTLRGDTATCAAGAPLTLTAIGGGAGSTYTFTLGGQSYTSTTPVLTVPTPPATAGDYPVTIQETNAAGCTGPLTTRAIRLNAVPGTLTLTAPATVCAEDAGTVTLAAANGLPGSTYQWTLTGGTITGGQGTATITASFDVTQGQASASVTETSAAGCVGTTQPVSVLIDATRASISATSTQLTDPTRIDLTYAAATTGPVGQASVQRRVLNQGGFADVATVSLAPGTFTDPSADPNTAAYEYRLRVQSACGQERLSNLGTTTWLQATSQDATGAVNLTWNAYAGAGTFARYEVLRRTGGTAGTYSVVETITDPVKTTFTRTLGGDAFEQIFRLRTVTSDAGSAGGETYSNETRLTFTNPVQTYNVITPDGNGSNDFFVIENATLYPNNELKVFSRWGREVFSQKNYANTWKADDLPGGTYYYQFTTADGKSFKGWVEVIR